MEALLEDERGPCDALANRDLVDKLPWSFFLVRPSHEGSRAREASRALSASTVGTPRRPRSPRGLSNELSIDSDPLSDCVSKRVLKPKPEGRDGEWFRL